MPVKMRDELPPDHPWAGGVTVTFRKRLEDAAATPKPAKTFRKGLVAAVLENHPDADPDRVQEMIDAMGG